MDGLIYFPEPAFLAAAWAAGAFVMGIAAAAMQERMRITGAGQWLLYLVFAPSPALYCVTLAKLFLLPHEAALPPAVLAMLFGFLTVHILLPAIMSDFQTDKMSTSMIPAFLLGLAVLGVGLGLGEFSSLIPGQQADLFGGAAENWQEGPKLPGE